MQVLNRQIVKTFLPLRPAQAYKHCFGQVLCIGGNHAMGGAIIIAAQAALHSGAGLVTVASDLLNLNALHSRIPEAMFCNYHDESALIEAIHKAQIILLGPGLGRDERAKQIFDLVLAQIKHEQILIIDADGLYWLSLLDQWNLPKGTILTPHLGEWRRLCQNQIEAKACQQIWHWAQLHQVCLVLKQARTHIYMPKQIWLNEAGNPAMATGGMGDCLAGMIAGFVGQFSSVDRAVLSAVYCHSALADELAQDYYSILPSLLCEHISGFMAQMRHEQYGDLLYEEI